MHKISLGGGTKFLQGEGAKMYPFHEISHHTPIQRENGYVMLKEVILQCSVLTKYVLFTTLQILFQSNLHYLVLLKL